ncbi:hypothetical protein SFR_3254 [Streptomyces sp. FR-008]|nr:hypothetical protein SFR_3254 [Streptomyces sp. FR-008]
MFTPSAFSFFFFQSVHHFSFGPSRFLGMHSVQVDNV